MTLQLSLYFFLLFEVTVINCGFLVWNISAGVHCLLTICLLAIVFYCPVLCPT